MSQSISEQRIAIIKDVLKLIPKIHVQKGQYCKLPLKHVAEPCFLPEEGCIIIGKSLQKQLNGNTLKYCQACALGSMFLSYVRVYNKVKTPNQEWLDIDYRNIPSPLRKIFSRNQLAIIEGVFEGDLIGNKYTKNDVIKIRNLCRCCYNDFGSNNASNRLIKICKNMIRNKGIFKFPTKVVQLSNLIYDDNLKPKDLEHLYK